MEEQITLDKTVIYSKLALFEQRFGYKTMRFYNPTYPSYLITGDDGVVFLQKEASQMMKFVGLTHHIPLITFTKTEQSEGGNIELDNGENVFIQISEKYRNCQEQLLAVMAHEICHKVLYTHGLYYKDKIMSMENEVLTDLATIYVGFGKLSLNGCYRQYTTSDKTNNKVITNIEKIGYITRGSFAMAYDIVCNRFCISEQNRFEGLNYYAKELLAPKESLPLNNLYVKDLKETIKNAQEMEAATYKSIVVLESVFSQIKDKIRDRYISTYNDLVLPFNYEDESLSQQQFLAIETIDKFKHEKRELNQISAIISEFARYITTDAYIGINLDEISQTLKDIECPICGFKKTKALQENKKALFKCNNCNHLFLWDGELPQEKIESPQKEGESPQKDWSILESNLSSEKKGVFFKLFKFFKLKRHKNPLDL